MLPFQVPSCLLLGQDFLAFFFPLLFSDYLSVGFGLFLKAVSRLRRAQGSALWDVVVGAEFIRSFRMMTLLFSPMLSFLALPIESSGGLLVALFFEAFSSAPSGSFTVFLNSHWKAALASLFFSLLFSIRLSDSILCSRTSRHCCSNLSLLFSATCLYCNCFLLFVSTASTEMIQLVLRLHRCLLFFRRSSLEM